MTDKTPLSKNARTSRTGSAGWMIQRLARRLNATMADKLRPFDLKIDQFALLMVLAEGDNLTQTELGKRFDQPNYAVTRSLDHLAELGLVERRDDANSRRTHRIFLTKQGRALMPELFLIVSEVNAHLLVDLGEAERAVFLTSLGKILG